MSLRHLSQRWTTLVVALTFLMLPLAAQAQVDLGEAGAAVESRRMALEALEAAVAADGDKDFIALRTKARELRSEAATALEPIREARDRLLEELDALGPPPEEGQPAENETLAAERARLEEEQAEVNVVFRQSELNVTLVERVLNDIADGRRALFYDNIFVRRQSPADPALISDGTSGFLSGLGRTASWVRAEISSRERSGRLTTHFAILGGAIVVALFLFIPVRRRLNVYIRQYMNTPTPPQSRQVIAAAAQALARTVPGVLGGFIVFQALRWVGVISSSRAGDEAIAQAVWLGLIAILAVDGAATAVVAQRKVGWRLLPLSPSRGAMLRLLLLAVTAILAADAAFRAGSLMVGAPQETALLQSALVAVLLGVSLFLISRKGLWRRPQDLDPERRSYIADKRAFIAALGLAAAVVIVLATLAGYVAFAYFAATRIFFLLGLLGVALCLRGVLREAIAYLSEHFAPKIEDEETEPSENLTVFWLRLLLDIALLVAFAAPAFLILGAEWSDVRDAVIDAFLGFKVGSVTISIADVLTGVVVFMAILWATRAIQTTVETRLFPRTKLDEGVRHSFRTLIGYAGVVIAGLAAVGAVGADLSSLAIVAGALSVGIGFGLQSIVSNFVSGLILLFERPIKVGDWIVTASGQGYVKRISVRSTEILTFDRSSVIVPNSELVSGTVTNLTLGDKVGRIIIPVGASYDADPEEIVKILTEIAAAHPKVMRDPAPFIYFAGLGDSSIDFEVRVFLRDIAGGLGVTNDIRLAIFKRFREEGIEIPFPQRVVHIAPANAPDNGAESGAESGAMRGDDPARGQVAGVKTG